jgi:mannosyltransferase OCH1-like enzyme
MDSIRHILRRIKYLLLALINLQLPRKSIYSILPPFEEALIEENSFPKVAFLTWKTDKLAKSHHREIEKMVRLNPDWKFLFFDDVAQENWMINNYSGTRILNVYVNTVFGASKTDIFRYCLMQKYGGAFISINISIVGSLTEIVGDGTGLVLSEALLTYNSPFVNGVELEKYKDTSFVMEVLVARRNHHVFELAISMICERYDVVKGKTFEVVDKAVWFYTGPFLFTDAILMCLGSCSKVDSRHQFDEIPKYFGGLMKRPRVARFRYMDGPSYIGFSKSLIAI